MTLLIAAAATFLACFVLVPATFGLLRIFLNTGKVSR